MEIMNQTATEVTEPTSTATDGAAPIETPPAAPAAPAALQAEIAALKAALQAERDTATVTRVLCENGAKNPAIVGKLLDLDSIARGADGTLSEEGLRVRITSLRDAESYLFADASAAAAQHFAPQEIAAGQGMAHPPQAMPAYRVPVVRDPDAMSDAEYYRMRECGT